MKTLLTLIAMTLIFTSCGKTKNKSGKNSDNSYKYLKCSENAFNTRCSNVIRGHYLNARYFYDHYCYMTYKRCIERRKINGQY